MLRWLKRFEQSGLGRQLNVMPKLGKRILTSSLSAAEAAGRLSLRLRVRVRVCVHWCLQKWRLFSYFGVWRGELNYFLGQRSHACPRVTVLLYTWPVTIIIVSALKTQTDLLLLSMIALFFISFFSFHFPTDHLPGTSIIDLVFITMCRMVSSRGRSVLLFFGNLT